MPPRCWTSLTRSEAGFFSSSRSTSAGVVDRVEVRDPRRVASAPRPTSRARARRCRPPGLGRCRCPRPAVAASRRRHEVAGPARQLIGQTRPQHRSGPRARRRIGHVDAGHRRHGRVRDSAGGASWRPTGRRTPRSSRCHAVGQPQAGVAGLGDPAAGTSASSAPVASKTSAGGAFTGGRVDDVRRRPWCAGSGSRPAGGSPASDRHPPARPSPQATAASTRRGERLRHRGAAPGPARPRPRSTARRRAGSDQGESAASRNVRPGARRRPAPRTEQRGPRRTPRSGAAAPQAARPDGVAEQPHREIIAQGRLPGT